jgi:prepilin-type N-terminal cleavage/methylation domain-containing protein/prepilin-type processing-associated H-X9-DG protein
MLRLGVYAVQGNMADKAISQQGRRGDTAFEINRLRLPLFFVFLSMYQRKDFITSKVHTANGRDGSSGAYAEAFTLVELLVVIAIIALLMAILAPALSRAKEQTRNVVCRSNMHQYGLAIRVYLDENNRKFPFTMDWLYSNTPSGYCQWHDKANNLVKQPQNAGLLWPYLKLADIHLCRTFKRVAKNRGCNTSSSHDPSIPIEPQYSYSMNAFLGGDGKGMVSHESQVRHPARVFVFSEENSWAVPGLSRCGVNDNNLRIGIPPDVVDCFATYHLAPGGDLDKGSANLVFLDGHVGSIRAEEQLDGNNFTGADVLTRGLSLAGRCSPPATVVGCNVCALLAPVRQPVFVCAFLVELTLSLPLLASTAQLLSNAINESMPLLVS